MRSSRSVVISRRADELISAVGASEKRMATAARPAPSRDEGPESQDDIDVPALVFCAVCGRADCAGCLDKEKAEPVGSTPWETAGTPVWKRLWPTARLATVDGETFFGGLSDGNVAPALGFAFACETVAILSFALVWVPLAYAMAPGFVESIFRDPEQGHAAIVVTLLAVPMLATLMVALHVSWAVGLEMGLRFAGADAHATHCLRYALYSCGWDLVTSPFGFGAGCVTGGLSGATSELRAAVRVPRFATRAYLGRARKAGDRAARRALLVAVLITGTIVLGGAATLGVGIVATML
jgi:hypothetical protein